MTRLYILIFLIVVIAGIYLVITRKSNEKSKNNGQ